MMKIGNLLPALAPLLQRQANNIERGKKLNVYLQTGAVTVDEFRFAMIEVEMEKRDVDAQLLAFRDKRQNIVNSPTHLYVTGV